MNVEHLGRHFDRHAADFDLLYDDHRQSAFRRWLNRRFHSDIPGRYNAAIDWVRETKAQSVLDVGCGPGRYLATLAQRSVPRLVGIDLSAEMLDRARRDPAIASHPNTELVQADFGEWISNETFDIVIAMGFFDYQSAPGRMLRKLRDHTRHSVIASFPARHWLRSPFRQVRRRLQGTRVFFYNPQRVRDLAQGAGFRECRITILSGAGMNLIARFKA